MPIKTMHFKNFKCHGDLTLSFNDGRNELVGANGSGKSSTADGLAFAYFGVDRFGNRNPQHLIKMGEDKTEITIDTGKVKIFRSLTRKGSVNLKKIVGELSTTMNQTQLAELLGDQDVFMSAMFSGYFMSQTPAKRKSILAAVTPQVDPYEVVLAKTGENVRSRYDLSKKSTLSTISSDRLEISRKIEQLKGAISVISEDVVVPEKPVLEMGVQTRIDTLLDSKRKWSDYIKAQEQHKVASASLEKLRAKKIEAQSAIDEATSSIETYQAQISSLFELKDYSSEIAELRKKIPEKPSKPTLQKEVDFETCPTCGTKVSRKMAEAVTAANKKLMSDYEEQVVEWQKKSDEINASISKLSEQQRNEVSEYNKIADKNREAESRIREQETRITRAREFLKTEEHALPEIPSRPDISQEEIESELLKLNAEVDDFKAKKAVYDNALKQMESQDAKASKMREQLPELEGHFSSLQKIEDVVKELPNIIMEMNKNVLDINGLEVKFENGEIFIERGGIPYTALSTGQRMHVDILLAKKINSLMGRPVNILFVDDADLMDEKHHENTQEGGIVFPGQVFAASVGSREETITVK